MWKCKNCNENIEDNFDKCWSCGSDKSGNSIREKERIIFEQNKGEDFVTIDQINKVVNVTLTGGIVGLFAMSPQNSLNDRIVQENAKGWRVIQIIPAASGNIFLFIFRLLILIGTLFLYTPVDGYYVIMEKRNKPKNTAPKLEDTKKEDNHNCNKCGKHFNEDDVFCQNCGNKLKN